MGIDDILSLLKNDPFTHLSPGPEAVDQLHLWRSIIDLLKNLVHDFYQIQFYKDEKEARNDLAKQICDDFNSASGAAKSIFINLLHLMGSPIASWAFTFKGLNEFKVTTAFSQTAEFQLSIDTLVDEHATQHGYEDVDDLVMENDKGQFDRIYNEKKKQVFNEVLDIFTVCERFRDQSSKLPIELTMDESISHEYKASFRTPYSNIPEGQVDDQGQKYFVLGREWFKSQKEVQRFIEEQCLKTIVGFLNTKGGTLIIGVHERNQKNDLIGIGREGFESNDHYERHINQQIQNRIGRSFLSDQINIEFLNHDGKYFCKVNVEEYIPSGNDLPALLDDKKCFRRSGPRTDELTPIELAKFSLERNKSKQIDE